VVGGVNGSSIAEAEIYDPATGGWTSAGSLSTSRYDHTATLLPDGKVLVAGGVNYVGGVFTTLDSAELYDPAENTWTTTDSLKNSRSEHIAVLLPNGLVLVAGGWNGGYPAIAELYDPVAKTWANTGSLQVPRNYTAAVLLPNGNDYARSRAACEAALTWLS
jgi:N-acetylneuraminic acid mutarotase